MPAPLRFLTGNWQLKLLALALAVLLWIVVSAEQVTSHWIPVPLRVEENDPAFELVSPLEFPEVPVRFTGSGRDLMELAIRKPPLVLTLDQVQGASQEYRLEPAMVRIPNQLAVTAQEVRSPLVRLDFRRLAVRVLRVVPQVDRDDNDEWTLVDSLRVLPAQIELRGPAERVERLGAVQTVPFDLPAADSTFSTIVRIDTAGLGGLELSTNQVRVTGRVDRIVQRRLSDIPISVGGGVVVRPAVVDVVLAGPRSVVELIQPGDFRVVVAIQQIPSDLPAEGLSVPVRVEQVRSDVSASAVPPAVRLLPAVTEEDVIGEEVIEEQLDALPSGGAPDG